MTLLNTSSDTRTLGQKLSDKIAAIVGSWRFVGIQSILLATWLVLNITGVFNYWDPYPFILLNLLLSFQAAYTAPIIMMSQNRQAEIDRQILYADYELDKKGQNEIVKILQEIDQNNKDISENKEHLNKILTRLEESSMKLSEVAEPSITLKDITNASKAHKETLRNNNNNCLANILKDIGVGFTRKKIKDILDDDSIPEYEVGVIVGNKHVNYHNKGFRGGVNGKDTTKEMNTEDAVKFIMT